MPAMKFRQFATILILTSLVLIFVPALSHAEGKFNLKPGATGKVCLTCHTAFAEKLKAKHVHTPLTEGECTGCHNPHASGHDHLLDAEPDLLCYNCHDNMVPKGAVSVHKVVAEGQCVACHDPHASDNPSNLVKAGEKLCFGCHKELGKKISENKFQHAPVKKDCLLCHDPHASGKSPRLLKMEQPALCLQCHKTDNPGFKKQHMNYPVEKGKCSSCHDPHGSNSGAILADVVHNPVSNQMCNQCHNDPDSADPFGLKKQGFEICQGCHYDLINTAFSKDRLHWPLVDKKGCINCHTPHASGSSGLLRNSMIQVCGQCHADTIARQDRSFTKHQPISSGECTLCHDPHGSDNQFMLVKSKIVEACGQCHDWQTHSTHPIGDKVVDPRNPNLRLNCLSCHRTHGTEYKSFLHFSDIQTLCVQCHTKYRR